MTRSVQSKDSMLDSNSKWFIAFGIFAVTLIFYCGISYNRLGVLETSVTSMSKSLEKLSDLEDVKVNTTFNSSRIDRLETQMDHVTKLIN